MAEAREAYPDAEAWIPPQLARKMPAVAGLPELSDAPQSAWAEWIDQVVLRGSAAMEEVVFFHRASRTALVCDFIQRHDPAAFNRWQRALMAADGLLGEHGSTPRELRATFLRRGPARAALDHALGWDPDHLVIAHGANARGDGAAVLADGLAWIRKPWPL
jgi:hypothetical protein